MIPEQIAEWVCALDELALVEQRLIAWQLRGQGPPPAPMVNEAMRLRAHADKLFIDTRLHTARA